MLNALWRAAVFTALIASAALFPLQWTLVSQSGTFGLVTNYAWANAPELTPRVVDVVSGSPADRAGIRPGDELPLDGVDRDSRVRLSTVQYVLPGDVARYRVVRGAESFAVAMTAVARAPYQPNVPDTIRAIAMLCVFLFAVLVVVRAWNSAYGPLIATLLVAALSDAMADRMPWAPPFTGIFAAIAFGPNAAIDALCTVIAAFLPIVLAGRLTGSRGLAFRLAAVPAVALTAFILFYTPFGLTQRLSGTAGPFAEFAYTWLLNTLPFYAAAIPLLVAYATAGGESRQRMRWVVWGFVPYYLGVGLINTLYAGNQTAEWLVAHGSTTTILGSIFRALEMALPVALFYGVLVRRVIDIGFVFNRVAVYGILSLVLVAAFVLTEYLVSHFFLEGRSGSLAVQILLALAIGLSARYLHRIVERVVDDVLFAKRHADERALHRFAKEADAFTSADALLDRTMETLGEHSEARGAAIYRTDADAATLARATGPAFPARVAVDDPLLVSLRTWHEPVDTHDVKTTLPDGLVFPMRARGSLVGILACETKADSSAFDPDERRSIEEVAHAIALALEALRRAEPGDTVLKAIGEAISGLERRLDAKLDTLRG